MRIAIIFSSPRPGTGEYKNIWDICPQKREVGAGKLVIEGNDWKLFVFDGRDREYYSGAWVFETLSREVANIIRQYGDSSVALLLHDTENKLARLRDALQSPDDSKIIYKWYTSSKGTFYNKYLKPFAADGTESLFDELWTKLTQNRAQEAVQMDPMGELRFLSHKFSNIPRFMKIIADDAKEDMNILLEFKKFDIEDLLERFARIEPELMKLKIIGVDRVRSTMEEVMEMIRDIQKENIFPEHALGLAYQCIEKTESVCNTFKKTLENSDD